jgi:hypothetical protein
MSKARGLASLGNAYDDGALSNRNVVINGNFDVWQRGTSQTDSGYGSDDRWSNLNFGSTKVADQQTFTLGQTDVTGNPKYYSRTVVTSVAGAPNFVLKRQSIEGVTTFSGETTTLTFWAKADSNKNIAVEFYQNFGSGGSPSGLVFIPSQTVSLTSGWVKHSLTFDIPSVSGKTLGTNGNDSLSFHFWFEAGSDYDARTNNLGQQSGTFDIAQVQLEQGDTATPFEHRSLGPELALCQRYYFVGGMRHRVDPFPAGVLGAPAYFPTTMRTIPTITTTVGLGTLSTSAADNYKVFFEFTSGTSGNISTAYTADAEL